MSKHDPDTTSQGLWATRCPRLGMVLVLRRVPGGVEYVLFDPALQLIFFQAAYYKASKFAIMQFRSDLMKLLRTTMRMPVFGGWVGGTPTRFQAGWDSVQVCCEWIRQFVSEATGRDPFPTTEEGWEAAGYSFSDV